MESNPGKFLNVLQRSKVNKIKLKMNWKRKKTKQHDDERMF